MTEKLVEENLGLVHHFIRNHIRGSQDMGAYSYEDLYQVGCIGLWKAAKRYVPGNTKFSTYAYMLIRNEVYSELQRQSKFANEICCSDNFNYACLSSDAQDDMLRHELSQALHLAKTTAAGTTQKGIFALELTMNGMKCSEIALRMQAPVNHVIAWMSKARKYLCKNTQMAELMEAYYAKSSAA